MSIQQSLHQANIIKGMASVYHTVHEINLIDYSMQVHKVTDEIQSMTEGKNAVEMMRAVISQTVLEEDRDRILAFSELTTLADRMQGKSVITERFRGRFVGWCKEQFIAVETDDAGKPVVVIHTTEVIDEQVKQREIYEINEKKQSSIIYSLAGEYVSIYYINLKTGAFDVFRRSNSQKKLVQESSNGISNYFEKALENAKKLVLEEDFAYFKRKFNKETILEELSLNNTYSFVVRTYMNGKPTYFQYRFVRPVGEDSESKLIVGVYNVDREVRNEMRNQEQISRLRDEADQLALDAYHDAMTGLYNRRSYEKDMQDEVSFIDHEECCYIAIDINGLKGVNDSMGHDVGDELILGSAFCISTCLGTYGKAYRIGGDEFVAIVYADEEKRKNIFRDFEETVEHWSGEKVKKLSVSYGYVTSEEFANKTAREIAKLADQRMYENKKNYYKNKK